MECIDSGHFEEMILMGKDRVKLYYSVSFQYLTK